MAATTSNGTASRSRADREQHWRDIVARWEKTGQTQTRFCRQRGISVFAFRWWRHRLMNEPKRRGAERRPSVSFLPVQVVDAQPLTSASTSTGLEIQLRGGRLIRVREDFNPDLLRKLLSVLEEEPRC
jgi:hypothetical protein